MAKLEMLKVFISYSFIGATCNGYIVTVQKLDGTEIDRFCSGDAVVIIRQLHNMRRMCALLVRRCFIRAIS